MCLARGQTAVFNHTVLIRVPSSRSAALVVSAALCLGCLLCCVEERVSTSRPRHITQRDVMPPALFGSGFHAALACVTQRDVLKVKLDSSAAMRVQAFFCTLGSAYLSVVCLATYRKSSARKGCVATVDCVIDLVGV